MQKYRFFIFSLFLATSSVAIYAAPPTITVSGDNSTVTYEGGTVNGALVQDGNIKKLVVKGTEVVNGSTSLSKGAVISLGGVNGADRYNNNYGNLEVEVDKNTSITATASSNIVGIYVRTDTADSLAKVTSGATINLTNTSSFPQGVWVENKGGSGELSLTQDSDITVTGNGAIGAGISAKDNALIVNQGNMTLNGDYGVVISATAGTANVTSTGNITTNGLSNVGISVNATGADSVNTPDIQASGKITIGQDTAGAIVNGASGSKGISLTTTNKERGSVIYNDEQNSIRVNAGSNSANITSLSAGIYSANTGGGSNYITAITKSIDMFGDNSAAIIADNKGGTAGNIQVKTVGDVNIKGGNTVAIKANNSNTQGTTVIDYTGNISITGSNATNLSSNIGIDSTTTGAISMVNVRGSINIDSDKAVGVSSVATNTGSSSILFGDVNKAERSSLNIESLGNSDANKLIGLFAQSNGLGNTSLIQVSYADVLKVSGEGETTTISANGAKSSSAMVSVMNANVISATSTKGNATAISAKTINLGDGSASVVVWEVEEVIASATEGKAIAIDVASVNNSGASVSIIDTKLVRANSTDGVAINAVSTVGDNVVSLLGDTTIQGGTGNNGAGINLTSTVGNIAVNNLGATITSDNDLAVITNGDASRNSTDIFNTGKIIGYVTLNGGNVTVNNEQGGLFSLQDFGADGNNKGVSTSTIGTDGKGVFNNRGSVAFGDKNFIGSNINTASHAVIEVGTFNNAGIIDLTTNSLAKTNAAVHSNYIGNTLTINGNYVSDGGQLIVNTLVGKNNSVDGKSDQLIVNGDVSTGTGGATLVTIRPTQDSISALITNPDHGIKIIEVNGISSSDAFMLNSPVLAGRYEYILSQPEDDPTNYNWYLSNKAKAGWSESYNLNPSIGAYLSNQTAATEMFRMSLFDRLVANNGASDDAEQNFLWFRTKMTHDGYRSASNALSNRSRTYMAQMGGDLAVLKLETGYLHLGVMAGYGDHKNTSTSRNTRTKAEGKVKGYNVGGYATYFANRDTQTGLYIDTWTEMSWFRNTVEGKGQLGTHHYNSNVWSNSVEVGYGLSIANNKQYEWLITPQQQFIYNLYDADNQRDKNGLIVTANKASGLVSRTGIRLHGRGVQKSMLEPFLEANWINSTAKNQLKFNGENERDGLPRNRYEAKIGVQGNINNKWSLSGEIGGVWGENKYKSYQTQINVNYHF